MTAADKIAEARLLVQTKVIRGTYKIGGVYYPAADTVAALADLADAQAQRIEALEETLENAELRRSIAAFYGNHTWLMRVIIDAAGDLPRLGEGDFRRGFEAGIEEAMARADLSAPEAGTQLQDAWVAIAALMSGNALLVNVPDGSTAAQWAEVINPVHKQTADAQAQEIARLRAFRARIEMIADDFTPDNDKQAPLALGEMRDALHAALGDTP